MKDGYGGKVIYEFGAPKPKSYTIIDENNCEKSAHKDHTSNFKSSEFKDAVNDKNVFRHIMIKLSAKNHKIYTQESNKTSTSCFDDKRYIKDDGINTLAHGHKDIQINNIYIYFFLIFNSNLILILILILIHIFILILILIHILMDILVLILCFFLKLFLFEIIYILCHKFVQNKIYLL